MTPLCVDCFDRIAAHAAASSVSFAKFAAMRGNTRLFYCFAKPTLDIRLTAARNFKGAARADFASFPGTPNDQSAKVKKPAKNRLIELDAFDLAGIHFDGVAAKQPPLDDNALAGDGNLRRTPLDPFLYQQDRRHQYCKGTDCTKENDWNDLVSARE